MLPATETELLHRNQTAEFASDSTNYIPSSGGKLIVLTAPLTETIDHAGYFIQMALASLPQWLEFVLNKKYPKWREVERNEDGTARYMPAGVRVLEKSLLREYAADEVVACFPDDLDKFIGPKTRVVAVSTHNPLGVTFAAGVYTSIFGSSKEPLNSIYSRAMFDKIKSSPYRKNFQVVVGGSGGWQITQTNKFEELGVDCVAEGRSESADAIALFQRAIAGETLPREINLAHPTSRDDILFPDKRTTFGVVEMTTGCGRRCQFCVPDLNPQIDMPKARIMDAVRANVRARQQSNFSGHRGHVYLGPGPHRHPVLLSQSRSAGGSLHRNRQYAGCRAPFAQPLHDGAFCRGSRIDPAALGSSPSEESYSSAAAQLPSAEEGAGPFDRA